jgi:hypothetical protein
MKNLNEYLIESAKQYEYRVKIAGEMPEGFYDKFKNGLDKFSLTTASKPKTTPIQSDPVGFPGLENQEINIFDITLDYPASTEQVRELARQLGLNLDSIVVVDKSFNDSMNKEAEEQAVEDDKVRLETPDYPANTKEQNEAKDEYADSYETAARAFAGEAETDFEIAGEKTKPATYSTDAKEGKDSPMTKTKRLSIKDIMK